MPVNNNGKSVSPHAPAGEHTAEELEFIKAMDALRKRLWMGSPRRLPAVTDVLAEVLRLGYRKVTVGAGEGTAPAKGKGKGGGGSGGKKKAA